MKVSVIVPVFKEEKNIPEFVRRIVPVLEKVTTAFEIIFAMDPSPDKTEEVVLEHRSKDSRVKLLKFSRRFGQPMATLAGLQYCDGDVAVVMDVDLQDPPELIYEMVEKYKSGYDVVYAQRRDRDGETWVKKVVSAVGYRVINRLADVEIPPNTGDFRLLSRRVIEEVLKLKESHGFLRGLVALVGFKQTSVLFDRPARFSGPGNYNRFFGSLRIGLNGLICFSNNLLGLCSILGFLTATFSFLLAICYAAMKVRGFPFPMGNPTIVILILFMGGVQLISVGILGEYIGRIYDEVKERPRFIVDKAAGFSESTKTVLKAILFCAFLPVASVNAQEITKENLGENIIYDLDMASLMNVPVQTASQRVQKISEAPANVLVITREQIINRHYVTLRDLLRDLPSVEIQENSVEDTQNLVSIRGNSGNNKLLIMRNGHRLLPLSGEPLAIEDNYPLYDTKQVEVIYGPAAALYGPDAFAGIVNIITQKPEELNGAVLSGMYGTDNYRYGYARYGKKLTDVFKFELGAHLHGADNPNLAKAYPSSFQFGPLLDPSGQVSTSAPARKDSYSLRTSSYSIEGSVTLNEKFTVGYNERSYTHMTAVSVPPAYEWMGDAHWKDIERLLYLSHRFDITKGISNSFDFTYVTSEISPTSSFRNTFSNYLPAYKYMNNQTMSAKEQLEFHLSPEHDIVAGFQWSQTHSLPKTADLSNPLDPNRPPSLQDKTYPGYGGIPVEFYELSFRSLGGYAQMQSVWGKVLSSNMGVRYDNDTRFGGTINPRIGFIFNFAGAGASESKEDRQIAQAVPDGVDAAAAGSEVEAAPQTELAAQVEDSDEEVVEASSVEERTVPLQSVTKVLYGEAYRAPSTFDMYQHYGAFAVAGNPPSSYFFHLPNPGLRPEKARTVELNHTQGLSRQLVMIVSGYFSKIDSIILEQINNSSVTFPPGPGGGTVLQSATAVNLGRATLYGGDLSLHFDSSIGAFKLSPWVNYTLSMGSVDTGLVTTDVPYNSMHKVKGGVSFQYGKFTLTPRVRMSSRTSSQRFGTSMTKSLTTPSYAVYDLSLVARDLVKDFTATLDIRNLFDRGYFNVGSGTSGINFLYSPQDTRQIVFELSYKF